MQKGSREYFDDKHFPMGFRRSGDFTIPEAKLLAEYGVTLKQLSDGKLSPNSEQEQQFMLVLAGSALPQSPIEKVWLKYLKVTSPKAYVSIYGNSKPEVDNDAESSNDNEDIM